MKIYLAGTGVLKREFQQGKIDASKFNVLESFYSIQDWQLSLLSKYKNFLLDSGAFTFRHNNKNVNWKEYTIKYGEFVKKNNIELFFEMDIDNVVGYENVLELRKLLEDVSERKSIPVWHINRGKDDFVKMCENYDYVAIGGIAGGVLKKRDLIKYFPWFINVAHQHDCKIHGLGFTNMSKLCVCHFDSVDSTTWTNGVRFGELQQFDGKKIIKHASAGHERKLIDSKKVMLHNLEEWNKFNKYAELYL